MDERGDGNEGDGGGIEVGYSDLCFVDRIQTTGWNLETQWYATAYCMVVLKEYGLVCFGLIRSQRSSCLDQSMKSRLAQE